MRKWQAIPVAVAVALLAAVTVSGLVGIHGVGAVNSGMVQMEVDCDTGTAGVQASCSIAAASTAAIPIDVVMTNNSGAAEQIDSFGYELYNDQCSSPLIPPAVGSCIKGNTSNAAGGIGPSVPAVDLTNFPAVQYGCGSPPASADLGGTEPPGTSTSFLSCVFSFVGTTTLLPAGSALRLSGESFTDNVGGATTIVLTLKNVSSADDAFVTTISCDSAGAGPCYPATLTFTGATLPTSTPVPPTATPTATGTPCAPNCPAPTSLAFVTITPNAKTLTATAGTAVPATAAPPPPPAGGGGQPTGNTPGGGAGAGGTGAGGSRPVTLPDTGAGRDGGIDWMTASLLALVAVAIGGMSGAMYFGAAQLMASRRERDD